MQSKERSRQLDQVQAFTVPSWGRDNLISAPVGPDDHAHIWEKAEVLELAKRRAIASYTKMCSAPDTQQQAAWTAATTRDERDVLCARVDLLNALMHNTDVQLCPENTAQARVAVVYDRVRCDGETELGPMQSTMSWVVYGAEDAKCVDCGTVFRREP